MTTTIDSITLEILKNAYGSVPTEMGLVLKRTAYSPNIKERMDASCALFDPRGRMVAQAEHIPVHLGAMPATMRAVLDAIHAGDIDPREGDQYIVNDPFSGGSHLPDITMVKPVFLTDRRNAPLLGYVVTRAHHADVGGTTPGSMPALSTDIFQEGLRIPLCKLVEAGRENRDLLAMICANTRTPEERRGDLRAQIAANTCGERRLREIVEKYGEAIHFAFIDRIIRYSEERMRKALERIPAGRYPAVDRLDGDGTTDRPVRIEVAITVTHTNRSDGTMIQFDLSNSAAQVGGNVNAPLAVTVSAVYFALRAVTDPTIPPNAGCYAPVEVVATPGSVLNPYPGAAVSAGNVETSQRIVDVVLLALADALPKVVPAQSQGTMNNITIGRSKQPQFTYYETVGGGQGALPDRDGTSGIHVHMTNTANTPIESLESTYPLRVREYSLISGSGGKGRYHGGDGIRRSIEVLCEDAVLSIQSDRRRFAPKGLAGGEDGRCGHNYLIRDKTRSDLAPKTTQSLRKHDIIVMETPGGGGYGAREDAHEEDEGGSRGNRRQTQRRERKRGEERREAKREASNYK